VSSTEGGEIILMCN